MRGDEGGDARERGEHHHLHQRRANQLQRRGKHASRIAAASARIRAEDAASDSVTRPDRRSSAARPR